MDFSVISDWMRKWREVVKPITQRGNAIPKQVRITFNARLKSALIKD